MAMLDFTPRPKLKDYKLEMLILVKLRELTDQHQPVIEMENNSIRGKSFLQYDQ